MFPRSSTMVRVLPAVLLVLAGSSSALGDNSFPGLLDLSSLDGTNGFVVEGIDPGDRSGGSVSSLGDINGDSIDDILIGAVGGDANGNSGAGETYVVFGKNTSIEGPFDASLELSAVIDGTSGFVIQGINAGDQSGRAVSSAGDVNGDGVGDILIGAPSADPGGRTGAGEAYVVFGGPGLGATGSVTLSNLTGANGFVIRGVSLNDAAGSSVASARDVNDDGVDDLIIGSPHSAPFGPLFAGRAHVVFGRDTSVAGSFAPSIELAALDGTDGFVINGSRAGDSAGYSVASAGDINGDGVDDVIIGVPGADRYSSTETGEACVVFGRDTANTGPFAPAFNLWTINWDTGFRVVTGNVITNAAGHQVGRSVAPAGDINHDGFDDVLIGIVGGIRTYVLFGRPTVGGPGLVLAQYLVGLNGFRIENPFIFWPNGGSVSAAGDINGDGVDDLIIGSPNANVPFGDWGTGESYVVFGSNTASAGAFPETFWPDEFDGTTGFTMQGHYLDAEFGVSVSSAGDVNGDGIGDFLVGAPGEHPHGRADAGATYVVFGRGPGAVRVTDLNRDGLTNVVDFNILASNFGDGPDATHAHGDLSGDGFVNTADFNIFAGDFGRVP